MATKHFTRLQLPKAKLLTFNQSGRAVPYVPMSNDRRLLITTLPACTALHAASDGLVAVIAASIRECGVSAG